MNKSIQIFILILPFYLQAVLGFDQMISITRLNPNDTHSVWMNDRIIINTMNITIQQWLFNSTLLTDIKNGWTPTDSAIWLLININKQNNNSDITNLSIDYARRFHTGNYAVNNGQDMYSANIIVYDVQLSSVEFVLHKHSNLCQAYLLINDFVDPSDIEIYRTVNSSDLIFRPTNQPNINSFEIINCSVNIAEKPINIDIDIQYQVVNNFYNKTISTNVLIEKSIDKPTIIIVGTSNNCTVQVHHQNNTDITCFRHIKYCLTINGTLLHCIISNSLDALQINYIWNWTSINLFVEYDIIFARYIFDFNIIKCADDVIFIKEFNTENSSSSNGTLIESYRSESGTADYSDSTDYLNSTDIFSTELDTATTIATITNSAGTDEVTTYLTITSTITDSPNITDVITTDLFTINYTEISTTLSSTTTNSTSSTEVAKPLEEWKIAVIAAGSGFGVLLIVGGIGLYIWKRKRAETFETNFSTHTWLPPQETRVEKPISQSRSYDHNRSVPIVTSLSESSERRHRKRDRHLPKTSEHHEHPQSTSSPPLPRSRARLERMERRRKRRRQRPTNHEEAIPMSVDPIHQHQVSHNRPRRVPPLHDD